MCLSYLAPLVLFLPKHGIIWLPNLSILGIPVECCSRTCALNLISIFALLLHFLPGTVLYSCMILVLCVLGLSCKMMVYHSDQLPQSLPFNHRVCNNRNTLDVTSGAGTALAFRSDWALPHYFLVCFLVRQSLVLYIVLGLRLYTA